MILSIIGNPFGSSPKLDHLSIKTHALGSQHVWKPPNLYTSVYDWIGLNVLARLLLGMMIDIFRRAVAPATSQHRSLQNRFDGRGILFQ